MKDAQEWQARSRLASIRAQPRYFKVPVYLYFLCFFNNNVKCVADQSYGGRTRGRLATYVHTQSSPCSSYPGASAHWTVKLYICSQLSLMLHGTYIQDLDSYLLFMLSLLFLR